MFDYKKKLLLIEKFARSRDELYIIEYRRNNVDIGDREKILECIVNNNYCENPPISIENKNTDNPELNNTFFLNLCNELINIKR